MALRINQNIAAYNAHRNLTLTDNLLSKSLERLSSGLRINRAADDAAGLSISEKLRSQVRGLQQAVRNAQDGISLIQTAEGALQETHAVLQRMRELAVQAANGTLTEADRSAIQQEINSLVAEVTRIAESTKFNEKTLLNGDLTASIIDINGLSPEKGISNIENVGATSGDYTLTYERTGSMLTLTKGQESEVVGVVVPSSFETKEVYFARFGIRVTINSALSALENDDDNPELSGSFKVTVAQDASATMVLHVGAYSTTGDNAIQFTISGMGASHLGINTISVSTESDARDAILKIDTAIGKVSEQRSALGAVQNRLEHTIANLGVAVENISASESRIRDVDMAAEMVNFTRQQIMIQAGTAMLAQANAVPQTVLQLLR